MKDKVSHSVARPLRVMHVLLTMGVGGAEKLVYDMIRRLDPATVSSSVCCLQDVGPLGDRLREQGVPVFLHERRQGVDWSMVGWLRQLMAAERIDVIHAHQYTPMFYAALAAAGLSGVRVVYTEHGRLYPEQWNWKRYLFNPLLSLSLDHIVSIAESTARAMARYDNFPARKIKVVHNGVDIDACRSMVDPAAKRRSLGLDARCRIIGTAARLEEIKNIPMMLRVFKRVLVARPDTVLLIAGRGTQEENLKALAAEMGMADQVRFLGLRFDMAEIYPLFEVFLLTSFTEGISVTLLEAMANGVPAVVTGVGGNGEVVDHGATGYLVPLDDDEAMEEQIIRILEDGRHAEALGANARQRVREHFSFEGMLDSYLDFYRGKESVLQ